MKQLLLALQIIIGTAGVVHAQEAPQNDCPKRETASQAPEYKVAQVLRFDMKKPYGRTEVYISVEPSHFTRSEMVSLAHRLNDDFCKEQKLYVRILDDYDIAVNYHPVAYERSMFKKAWRGVYSLNRASGEEYIQFSTAPKKPMDEIKITLGSASGKSR